jgi:hypothetical protein
LGVAFTGDVSVLLEFGAGIALPIAALALFIGMRAWSTHLQHGDDGPSRQESQPREDAEE